MVQHQDQEPLPKQYKTDAAPPDDPLITEKDTEECREKGKETTPIIALDQLRPHEDTTTSETQTRPPSEQVATLRQHIDTEDARHSNHIDTLQQHFHTERQRHTTRDKTFRSRLIDLSVKQRERLRNSPAKHETAKHGDRGGAVRQGGSYVARWLDGLRSISSLSEVRESSDWDSSVEVVAAKDAKGRGKGIRIVSDGIDETVAIVDGNVARDIKAKSN